VTAQNDSFGVTSASILTGRGIGNVEGRHILRATTESLPPPWYGSSHVTSGSAAKTRQGNMVIPKIKIKIEMLLFRK
jgi:hypothetical protein